MPQWPTPYSETASSRPVAAAALAIPDLVASWLLSYTLLEEIHLARELGEIKKIPSAAAGR